MMYLLKHRFQRIVIAIMLSGVLLWESSLAALARVEYTDFTQCKVDAFLSRNSESERLQTALEQDVTNIALAHEYAGAYAQLIHQYNTIDVHCRPLLNTIYRNGIGDQWNIDLSRDEIQDAIIQEYGARAVRLQLQKLANFSTGEDRGAGLFNRALDQLIFNRTLLENNEALLKEMVQQQAYAQVYGQGSSIDTTSPDFDIKNYIDSFYKIKKETMLSSVEEYNTTISELQKLVLALGVASGAVDRAIERGAPIANLFTSSNEFITSMGLPWNDVVALAFGWPGMVEISNYYTNYRLNNASEALNSESMMLLYAALDMEKEDWTPGGLPASKRFSVPELSDELYSALIEEYPSQTGTAHAKSISRDKNIWYYALPVSAGVILIGGIVAFSGFWASVGMIAIEGADIAVGGGEVFEKSISKMISVLSKGDRLKADLAGVFARNFWDWVVKGGIVGLASARKSAGMQVFTQPRTRGLAQRGMFGSTGRSRVQGYRSRAGQIAVPTQRTGTLSDKLDKMKQATLNVFNQVTGRSLTDAIKQRTARFIEELGYQANIRFKIFDRTSSEYLSGLNAVKVFDHATIMMQEDDFLKIIYDKGMIRPVNELQHVSPNFVAAAKKYEQLGQDGMIFAGRTMPWEKEFGAKVNGGVGIIFNKEVAHQPGSIVNAVNSKNPNGWFVKPSPEEIKQGMVRMPDPRGDFVTIGNLKKPYAQWKSRIIPDEESRIDFTAQLYANIFSWAKQNNLSTKTPKEMAVAVSRWYAKVGKQADTDIFPEVLLKGAKSPDDVYAYLFPEALINKLKTVSATADPETRSLIEKVLSKAVPYMKNKEGVVDADRYGKITEALGEVLDSTSHAKNLQ